MQYRKVYILLKITVNMPQSRSKKVYRNPKVFNKCKRNILFLDWKIQGFREMISF